MVLLFDSNTDRVPGQTNYSLAGWYIYNNTNNITRNIQSTYNHQASSEILSLRKSDLSTCLYLSHNFLSFIQDRFLGCGTLVRWKQLRQTIQKVFPPITSEEQLTVLELGGSTWSG